ncbi:MAG: low-specificity L-threonine aldolase [Desulfobacterales bacterium]|nr:low-specificity L-threonine aldolase [Desulfobacterales bacterium]
MHTIDLRSDTLTRPTEAMRKAMAGAEVGDDVFGEDPTVNRLEELAAEKMGKEAALFVASGTMANLISLLTHCGRGDEVILGDQAHIFFYEQGGCAALGGIHPRTVPNLPDGTLDLAAVEAAVRTENIHYPITRAIALENTHNRCLGTPLSLAYLDAVKDLSDKHALKIHMDGARIFNAAVALKTDPATLVQHADSVSFCLSKGLGAPVGSLVCGSRAFIARARRNRKIVGGGMRQAGILAAAGITALTENIDRLAEDHANARQLALGLSQLKGISVNPEKVLTNIVFIEVAPGNFSAEALARALEKNGVKTLALGPQQLRAVTNYHITADDIESALAVFRKALKQ